MNTWFTSDWHLGHKNILTLGAGRPFSSVEEHDETLIDNFNASVAPDDTAYFIGDISYKMQSQFGQQRLRGLLARIHCKNLYLVPGNHDYAKAGVLLPALEERFVVLPLIHMITVEGQGIVLCHYPLLEHPKMFRGFWHLHGHQHAWLDQTNSPLARHGLRLDVGVDGHGFFPVSMTQLQRIFDKRDVDFDKYFGGKPRKSYRGEGGEEDL